MELQVSRTEWCVFFFFSHAICCFSLEKVVEEQPVTGDELQAAIRRATIANKFVPVMMGAAFKNKGVQVIKNQKESIGGLLVKFSFRFSLRLCWMESVAIFLHLLRFPTLPFSCLRTSQKESRFFWSAIPKSLLLRTLSR